MSVHYKSLARRTQPKTVAVFPLNGAVLLPGCELPLNIFEPRYLNMVDDALKGDRLIGMIQTLDVVQSDATENGVGDEAKSSLCKVGCLGRIMHFSEQDDGRYLIVLKGLKRFNYTQDIIANTPYRQAEISFEAFEPDADLHDPKTLPEAMTDIGGTDRATLTVAMKSLAKVLQVSIDWDSIAEIPLPQLVNQTTMISPFKPADKQSLLEAVTTDERRRLLVGLLHLYAATGGDASHPSVN